MGFIFNNITIFILIFISICLIVIGFVLQTILIPLQDVNLISKEELLVYQKEYAYKLFLKDMATRYRAVFLCF